MLAQSQSELMANHLRLTPGSGDIIESLIGKSSEVSYSLNPQSADLPQSMSVYEYQVSPWPFIISKDIVDEFSTLSERLPVVLRNCLLTYFKNDPVAIEQYFSIVPELYTVVRQFPNLIEELFLRIDVVFSGGNLRLLEVNSGTSLGGWEAQAYKRQIKAVVSDVIGEKNNYKVSETLNSFFSSLYDNILTHLQISKGRKEINVLLLLGESPDFQYLKIEHARRFNDLKPDVIDNGNLHFAHDLTDTTFDNEGLLIYGGVRIDAVINACTEIIQIAELTLLHLRKKLYFSDAPFYKLYGNKGHFALMTALRDSEIIDKEDREFIKKYVPSTIYTSDLVRDNALKLTKNAILFEKDKYVIKSTDGSRGEEVYIGRYTADEKWVAIVEETIKSNTWIVQEYLCNDLFYSLRPEGEVVPSETVWGLFSFRRKYAGGFVRSIAVNNETNYNGVINSARGAFESIIFEER